MRDKKRLSRHDDRPGYALSLWHLWNLVPSTEELDGNDDAFTEQMCDVLRAPDRTRVRTTGGHP